MSQPPGKEIDLAIDGGVVITMDSQHRIVPNGCVCVDGGVIVAVDQGPCKYSARTRIDAADMIVMPGLVNAHDHLDQSLYRGCTDGARRSRDTLLTLARGMTPERAHAAAALTLLELIHYGVTATHESHWTHFHRESTDGICEAIQESGMRAVVARSMNDNEETPVEFREKTGDVIDDLNRLEKRFDSDKIVIIAEPTTMLRCTPLAIQAMHHWSIERNKVWHIHLSQDRHETAQSFARLGMGSVQYANELGVLGTSMLAAHCAGILPEEVDLLADARVRIAHCPDTVIRAGEQVPPIWDLSRRGAILAVGTDGPATNNGQNPWEAMKLALYLQRVRSGDPLLATAADALALGTTGAAQALGLANRVGSLEVGKEADVILLKRSQLHLLPDAALVNNLVLSGLNNVADTVLVHGQVLLRNGVSTVVDEHEVIARARAAQRELLIDTGLDVPLGPKPAFTFDRTDQA